LAQGLVPNLFITEYGVQIGSALEVILLSLALADRINLLQKQANDKDQLARENAEKANQAKSIFIANMSHEIRTPLNAVLGYTQMLERDRKLDERQQHSVAIIAKSSEHLLEVINDILDISKIEANAMTLVPVDFELVDLVEGIGVMFEGRCIDKNLNWQLQSQCDRPIGVYGDQVKLRQILINLLGNAVKFTRKGTVGLHLSSPKPGYYHFEVTDNGPGIDEHDHGEIFTAFGQTLEGSKHGGTGLGLAIASKQVDLMGGKLQLTSQPNQGSRFFFTLRLADAHGAIKSRHNRNIQTMKLAPGVCIRAMVVDDIKDSRIILRKMLEGVGIEVTEAENGLDGLNKLHKTTTMPDLVFIDIRMPIMDGI
ncbi:MAG: ATP-binding protein, partial [Psychrosphaera sp.]|nr:ATP-binding protein [Psychrosphaera sp.]